MKKWVLSTLLVGLVVACYCQFTAGNESQNRARKLPNDAVHRLPASIRITRSPDLSTLSPSSATYSVICEFVSDKLSFHTPAVMMRDGERCRIADCSQAEYVVATKQEGAASTPIARDLTEGSVIEVTVLALDQEKVVVDVMATLQSVDSTQPQGSLKVNTLSGRFIETVRLGGKASASFGDKDAWGINVTVQKAEPLRGEQQEQAQPTGTDK